MKQGNEREERGPLSPAGVGESSRPEDELDGAEAALLEPHIQEQLGRVLRSFCDDLIHQPIPDKFVVLLAQLEAKQREKK